MVPLVRSTNPVWLGTMVQRASTLQSHGGKTTVQLTQDWYRRSLKRFLRDPIWMRLLRRASRTYLKMVMPLKRVSTRHLPIAQVQHAETLAVVFGEYVRLSCSSRIGFAYAAGAAGLSQLDML